MPARMSTSNAFSSASTAASAACAAILRCASLPRWIAWTFSTAAAACRPGGGVMMTMG